MSENDPMKRLFGILRDTVDYLEKVVPAQAINTLLNRDYDAAVRKTEDYLQCPTHGGECTCDPTTPGCTKFGDYLQYAKGRTWLGWATPAIKTVLTAHQPLPTNYRLGLDDPRIEDRVQCRHHDTLWNDYPDYQGWLDHVAPLIAAAIGCDPERAAAALSGYKPSKV